MFLQKLKHGAALSTLDEQVLIKLVRPVRIVAARTDLWYHGSEPLALPLLVDGWACRYRYLENGTRQILTLLLPGDLCEPFGVLPQFADYSVGTLTTATVSAVSSAALREAARASPAIERALWWDLLVASSIEREHLVSLGRRSAPERLAHLFCELHLRLSMVGLVENHQYDLPATQSELADLLGLSAVHLNRSLQELRAFGLVSLHNRRLAILDLLGLRELALFDDAYLHAQALKHR